MTCGDSTSTPCLVSYWLWVTVTPTLLAVGTVGNIINVIILLRRRMRKYSTGVLLLSLALADIFFLWTTPFVYIYEAVLDIDVTTFSPVLCKCLPWIRYTSAGYSVWILVVLTLERMIMTRSLEHTRTKLTTKNAAIVSIVLLCICWLYSSHYVFGYSIQKVDLDNNTSELKCAASTDQFVAFYKTTWPVMVLVGLNFIPIVLIILGNITIVVNIIQQRRKLMKIHPSNNFNQNTVLKRKSLTKLLFLLCGFFIATTVPYAISNVVVKRANNETTEDQHFNKMIVTICFNFLFCNFSFNFFFYFVSGTLFKQEWKKLLEECSCVIRNIFHRRNEIEPNALNRTTLEMTLRT